MTQQDKHKSSLWDRNFSTLMDELSLVVKTAGSNISQTTVDKMVHQMADHKGLIFTIGIGKSGNIAQKVSATLSSLGAGAVFLHPSDAFHGSLGLIGKGDICLLFSSSGETLEILEIIPHLRLRESKIFSFVGRMESTLAKKSDLVIDCSIAQEICPHNLAPTSSTLVTLAAADTIAILVMQLRKVSKEDFARNHPAGTLGKKLTLKVHDLMKTPPPIVNLNAGITEVIEAITTGRLGATAVVDKDKSLLGIITDGDLRRSLHVKNQNKFFELKAKDIMTSEPLRIYPDDLASDALNTMEFKKSRISILPVVNQNNVVIGMLHIHDIVQAGIV